MSTSFRVVEVVARTFSSGGKSATRVRGESETLSDILGLVDFDTGVATLVAGVDWSMVADMKDG